MTDINWGSLMESAAKEGGFDILPVGDYQGTVVKSELKKTSKGNPWFSMQIKVNSPDSLKGRVAFANIFMTPDNPKAMSMFFKDAKAFGMDKEWFEKHKPSVETLSKAFEGRRIAFSIKHEEYNGSDQARVHKYVGIEGQAAPSVDGTPSLDGGFTVSSSDGPNLAGL